MGWKTINGRMSYYKSVREGGRVRSEYFGGGTTAKLIAEMDRLDRDQVAADRRADREGQDEERDVERALDALVVEAMKATAGHLGAAGYRRHHRGEWRKSRG